MENYLMSTNLDFWTNFNLLCTDVRRSDGLRYRCFQAETSEFNYRATSDDKMGRLEVRLPGCRREDLGLTVSGQTLTVAARLDGQDLRQDFTLDDDLDPATVTARYADGLLTVTTSRRAAGEPRRVSID
jgi:HSP20 family molecular chaperone IbpA